MAEGNLEEAKDLVRKNRFEPVFAELAEIIRGVEPDVVCEHCGKSLRSEWVDYMLKWVPEKCIPCEEEIKSALFTRTLSAYFEEVSGNIETLLIHSGVPKRFLGAKLSDFKANIKFDLDSGDGFYITGPRGTGKTHMAVGLLRHYLLHKKPEIVIPDEPVAGIPPAIIGESNSKFIPVTELLLRIRTTFNERNGSESEMDIISEYSGCPVLVLDDLGVEKTSEWSMQTLYTLVDRRYRDEMKTIITSNMTLDELAERVDDRIASRIAGMCKVQVLKGKDRRLSR